MAGQWSPQAAATLDPNAPPQLPQPPPVAPGQQPPPAAGQPPAAAPPADPGTWNGQPKTGTNPNGYWDSNGKWVPNLPLPPGPSQGWANVYQTNGLNPGQKPPDPNVPPGSAPAAPAAPPINLAAAPDVGGYTPGVTPGTLNGLDMTQPGALEQYQSQHAGAFGQPTLSQMFAKNATAQYGGPQQVTDNAQTAFNSMQSSVPANMDPYYDNQRRIANENINRSMAARGAYGSSAANDQISEADTNLAADQAQKDAAYGLNRSSLLGSLGSAADASSLNASGNQRGWTSALGALAQGGDSSGLQNLVAGGNLAGAAQGAQTTRGQNAFTNNLTMGDRMSGIMGTGYGNIFGADEGLAKDVIGLDTGTAADAYNQASQNSATQHQNAADFTNLFGNAVKLGQGVQDANNQSGQPMPAPPGAAPTYNYPNQTTVQGPTSIGPNGAYIPPPGSYLY